VLGDGMKTFLLNCLEAFIIIGSGVLLLCAFLAIFVGIVWLARYNSPLAFLATFLVLVLIYGGLKTVYEL
jgi:hypothetical protein